MDIATVGIDIGKIWFHIVGMNRAGKPVLQKKMRRQALHDFMANLPPCRVGMEACPGSQELARRLLGVGHDARIMAAQFVKPYLKSTKNDFNDAIAIAEAVQRPTMRFVPVKNLEQLDLQAMHRVRDQYVTERTRVVNQIRAFLLEYGLPVPAGRAKLTAALPGLLEDAENPLTPRMRALLSRLQNHLRCIEQEVSTVTRELETIAKSRDDCRRLLTVPGVGPLVATALVAAVGNAASFTRGRQLAAWLGLVPRQHSTGGKPRLFGISKRGNPYLRRLFIHGARSCYMHMDRRQHALGQWLDTLALRAYRNVAIVALANKLARIAWAVLTQHTVYRLNAA